MPKTITLTLYTYDELPTPEAKEKARDWWLRDFQFHDEFALDTITTVAKLLGFDTPTVRYNGFDSQGDGASLLGFWAHENLKSPELRTEFPTDETLHDFAMRFTAFNGIHAGLATVDSRYCHPYSVAFSYCERRDADGDTLDLIGLPEADELIATMRDFMAWAYDLLKAEFDDQQNEKYIADTLEANEYTFLENGERFEP